MDKVNDPQKAYLELSNAFKEKFDGEIFGGYGGWSYIKYNETPEYKEALKKYNEEMKHAEETMTEEEFRKWDWEHDQPDKPSISYDVPYEDVSSEENIIATLMKESLKCGKDLLYERYKDNITSEYNGLVLY